MPEAILFDLDDTIVAYGITADDCWRGLCYNFAPCILGLEAERLFDAIYKVRQWYWDDAERHQRGRLNLVIARQEIISLAFSRLGISDSNLVSQIADAYSTQREESLLLVSGAIDTLKHFQQQGLKLALVSNGSSDMQRAKVDRFKLAPFFNCITIEGEFGVGKPDERVFSHVLRELDVSPAEAWMVGDDLERDIGGAQMLGIYGIWVDWQGTGLPELSSLQPDRIINSLPELLNSDG